MPKNKGDPLGILNTHSVVNIKQTEGGPFGEKSFRKKVSQCRKAERGILWGFPTSILSQNSKKNEGGAIWGKNRKKVSQCRKK